ncbi:MAG: anaerobic ribonucleoside-triphosphate reductase activating protein [Muribaculaceae bacterium]|nr:anaerobic ribonucleoside-triphosphate reductase activating protein [Muribaculaceae bacterium]
MNPNETIRVLSIIDGTSVDGPGLRTSIYLAGCRHHCPACHNPESWDFNQGALMTLDEIYDHISEQDFDVTFSGGDPMEHAAVLKNLFKRLKEDGRNIWCYTGYAYEELLHDSDKSELLQWIDVLVDGLFINEQRDLSLLFRGSRNQRLIDVQHSSADKIILWKSEF